MVGLCRANFLFSEQPIKAIIFDCDGTPQIRAAKDFEIEWINQRYDEVEFVHSVFEKEIIAIAEIGAQKAGLGRLGAVNKDSFELGGMYVFETFRGKGVAGEIVKFLLGHVELNCIVYCIPFRHLVPFYERYGFSLCSDYANIPEEILKKFHWCEEKYANPTSLLVLRKRGYEE